jgi:hypothetical protein
VNGDARETTAAHVGTSVNTLDELSEITQTEVSVRAPANL